MLHWQSEIWGTDGGKGRGKNLDIGYWPNRSGDKAWFQLLLKINVIEEIQLRIPFLSTTKSFINKPKLIIKSQSIQDNQVMSTNENIIIITEKSIIKSTKDIIKAYLVEAETKMLDEIANEEN